MTKSSLRSVALHLALLGVGATIYAVPILQPRFAALTFVASLPWLWFILSPNNQRRKWSLIWFLGLIYMIGVFSLNWLNNLNLGAWLISPLFYILLFLPTFYITRALKTTWPTLPLSIMWGLSLTGTEWLRIRLSPGEVPFCQLGASLVPFSKLIQIVDVAGSSALSTLAAVATGFMADIVVFFFCVSQPRHWIRLWQSAGVVLTVFTLTLWYGYQNDQKATFSFGQRLAGC